MKKKERKLISFAHSAISASNKHARQSTGEHRAFSGLR